MTVKPATILQWTQQLVENSPDFPDLETCLDAIPDLDALDDLPAGTRILVRGDTDVVVTDAGEIEDDVRLLSLVETLKFGIERGWVQIVYGHRGRDPELSLRAVAKHTEQLLKNSGANVPQTTFISDWMNDDTGEILPAAGETVRDLPDGSLVFLENTRKYKLEQALWKVKPADLPALSEQLTNYANGMREQLASVHVNEGFASSNRDLSSTIVPISMDRVALGRYIDSELRDYVTQTRKADLVIFSGLKINKLDDLEQILNRGKVRKVIAAGSLAIGLKKAAADLAGEEFDVGIAKNPEEKTYIPPERLEQARRMLENGQTQGVEFILPVDFILGDGSESDTIPTDGAQFDIGSKSIALQAEAIGDFIAFHNQKVAKSEGPAVAFHNGVFGKFEEERFSNGTRQFINQLKRMHEAGVEVYVGGGEGGAALHRYGDESWVTHCFTAGGTILKALGSEPIPYLKALYMKSQS